jgi:Family of unknown function (DUF695)
MSEWILCERDSDGKTILVEYDATLTDEAFKVVYPYCALLTVNGFETNDKGLPTSASNDKLQKVKESIEKALQNSGGALAVMIASNGHFGYLTYVAQASDAVPFEAAAVALGLKVAHLGGEIDPEWASYKVWALSPEDLEEARRRPKPATH